VDETTMRERVGTARVARLATTTPSGRPHVVPICFAPVGDTVYSAVDGKPKSTRQLQRLANLRAHPEAALLIDHYDEDWTTVWWIRLDTVGRVLDPGAAQDRALAALRDRYEQYRRDPPPGPVIALDVVGWRAWP
jgi:PPOX class probable F420-dependent enzyme